MRVKLRRDKFGLQLHFSVRSLYIFLFKVYFSAHYLKREIEHDTERAHGSFRSSLTWPV